jgi:uncharacterized protein YbjT (DUF2867 family)
MAAPAAIDDDTGRARAGDAGATAGARHHVGAMRVLITGVSGFVGAALAGRLARDGHQLRGLSRDPARVRAELSVMRGDAVTGAGLGAALADVDVAYYLIHSMEPSTDGEFADRDRRAAERFAAAATRAGVGRVVYLGGVEPAAGARSAHLRSRLEVERILLEQAPGAVALRASIVIGARSRSFRFLVRLVERLRVLALPAWRVYRTQPIDERDVIACLAVAATAPGIAGASLDAVGPEVLSYGEMIERIADLMLVSRASVRLGFSATSLASSIAAAVAGEQRELILPLMQSLDGDLLARDGHSAAERLGVRLHGFDAAVEHALREWERSEPLRAR